MEEKRTSLRLNVIPKVVNGALILDIVGQVPSLIELWSSNNNDDGARKKLSNP